MSYWHREGEVKGFSGSPLTNAALQRSVLVSSPLVGSGYGHWYPIRCLPDPDWHVNTVLFLYTTICFVSYNEFVIRIKVNALCHVQSATYLLHSKYLTIIFLFWHPHQTFPINLCFRGAGSCCVRKGEQEQQIWGVFFLLNSLVISEKPSNWAFIRLLT